MRHLIVPGLALLAVWAVSGVDSGLAQQRADRNRARYAATKLSEVDEDFPFQGEYVGTVQTNEGEVEFGAQIIALGGGQFHGVGYVGGLPGAGWDGSEKREADGRREGDRVIFEIPDGPRAEITKEGDDYVLRIYDAAGAEIGKLTKTVRKSPTLGKKPPKGAVVLFDGSTAEKFINGRMTKDGLLMQGCMSKQKFGSAFVHIEFMTPYMPYARGQGRGNSGVYLQGRYEVQVLDSFGLEGAINECGAIYGVKPPDVNMCFPPLTWQTYDIEFHAPVFDEQGKKVRNARMTVWHNGVLIHRDVEIPGPTRAARFAESPEPGPLYLQDHGNPVRYRNIWIKPIED